MTDNPTGRAGRGKPKQVIIGLVLVFVLPFLLAWVARDRLAGLDPADTTASGTLVVPARPLAPFTFRDLRGGAFSLESLRGHWTLVMLDGAGCGDACRRNLDSTRQVRLIMGENMRRVERLLVVAGEPAPGLEALLDAEHPSLVTVRADAGPAARFAGQFRVDDGDPLTAQRVYIVDPLGNLMMWYAPGFELKGMYDDLKRLLKASRIG